MQSEFPDLPPYTYVPGHAPHPVSDPEGHLRDVRPPEAWSRQDHLHWGKRLFDHGYYWEAHEAWEHLWLELGRKSQDALAVKGLIKLAASAVKCRQGSVTGAIRHATRAEQLLLADSDSVLFNGCCDLEAARKTARRIACSPPVNYVVPSDRPVPLPGFHI